MSLRRQRPTVRMRRLAAGRRGDKNARLMGLLVAARAGLAATWARWSEVVEVATVPTLDP